MEDREPRTATSTFTQILSSAVLLKFKCYLTSTETIRTMEDREPRTATSTFTQLLRSYVHSLCKFSVVR